MKRYILLLLFLLIAVDLSWGQKTSIHITNPTITTRVIWSGYDIYYIDTSLTISSGGKLTINLKSGSSYDVQIIFTDPSYGMTIESTGALAVNGTSSRKVYFNADKNDNGHYDPLETWQNILFDGSTGTSNINYAIIEYGRGDSYGYGGGTDIYGSNITFKNCTIQHCSTSNDGGGIYVGNGSGITLDNLIIQDNQATGNGGGIYIDVSGQSVTSSNIYGNSASLGDGVFFNSYGSLVNSFIYNHSGAGVYVNTSGTSISNCVVYGNTLGVYFAASGKLINSTIINNNIGVTSATGPSSVPILLNTVLWGNSTAQYSGSNIALSHCGIQGGFSGGTDGGGNVNLDSSNGADTGPNFVNATSPDCHISSWITPIVDGGTTSYSGATAPVTDIEGHSRLSTTDIGAYEFFYYLWTGGTSTDWSTTSNWSGFPSSVPAAISENQVIIPKGATYYPTTSSLTLSSRSRVLIEPEAGLTVTGATTVDGGCAFLLKSDATGSANFITGSSLSGSFNVELYLPGSSDPTYNWHYVTTPVDGVSKTVLTSAIGNTNNLLNYLESAVTTDRMTGWQWHDGYQGTTGFSYLYNNQAYNVLLRNSTAKTASFTGGILTGTDFTFNNSILTCGTTDPASNGWHLIGNPFTCGVNVESFTFGSNVDKVIYYTSGNSYANWDTFTHQGTNFATNYIPGMQGFFVHVTTGSDKTLIIPASSRSYSAASIFKGSQISPDYPIVKFNISDGISSTDEALIYFFKDASSDFDGQYDAYKLLSENPAYPQIYTTSDNTKLSMNGLPYPDKITTVPLNLRIGVAKNYTINVLDLQNLDDYKVTLVHGTDNIDLKAHPIYTFYASAGTMSDMSIVFENILTSIPEVNNPTPDNTRCWYNNGNLYIQTNSSGFENNSSVFIYDLNGKVILAKNKFDLIKNNVAEIPVTLSNGLYITTIINSGLKVTRKIVVTE